MDRGWKEKLFFDLYVWLMHIDAICTYYRWGGARSRGVEPAKAVITIVPAVASAIFEIVTRSSASSTSR